MCNACDWFFEDSDDMYEEELTAGYSEDGLGYPVADVLGRLYGS